LLFAAKNAVEGHSAEYRRLVQAIQADHIGAAITTIKNQDIFHRYVEDITNECAKLLRIFESIEHLQEKTVKVEDLVMSKGEQLAAKFITALLQDRGVPAVYVDLSDILQRYGISSKREDFYEQLTFAFGTEIQSFGNNVVPVATGYFGHVQGGLLDLCGRGYSDLTAAILAVSLHASECQIWKEVDGKYHGVFNYLFFLTEPSGIFTADPRKVPTARLILCITPAETAELTFYGSEVVHPFVMQQVIHARIPIRIKNVMNPRGTGTIIYPDAEEERHSRLHAANPLKPKLFRTRSSSELDMTGWKAKRPTAVTIKQNIIVLNIHSTKRTRAHGFLAKIFGILDRHHLSVDLIASSEVHVSMAIHSERGLVASMAGSDDVQIQDERLQGAVNDLATLGSVDIAPDMCIVSLVGKELKNCIGISGKFFSVLGEAGINVEMISQGT
jgi:aspartate kinase